MKKQDVPDCRVAMFSVKRRGRDKNIFDFTKRNPGRSHKKPEIVGSSGWGQGTSRVEG